MRGKPSGEDDVVADGNKENPANAPKLEDLPAVCRCVSILVSAQAIFLNVYSSKLQSNMLNFSLLSHISNLIII